MDKIDLIYTLIIGTFLGIIFIVGLLGITLLKDLLFCS